MTPGEGKLGKCVIFAENTKIDKGSSINDVTAIRSPSPIKNLVTTVQKLLHKTAWRWGIGLDKLSEITWRHSWIPQMVLSNKIILASRIRITWLDLLGLCKFIRGWGVKAGAGNYFRSRATLRLYLCLAGQISVKKLKSKLKFCPSRAGCGSRAVCCPLLC